jgi:capsular polysaccharide biosynthesis protein
MQTHASQPAPNRSLEFSQKLYQRLLRAYPRSHREAYGPAMAQLFRDQLRDAWAAERVWGLAALWARILPDLVKTSFLERWSNFNPGKFMTDKFNAFMTPRHSPTFVFFLVLSIIFFLIFSATVVVTYLLPDTYASTARIKISERELPIADNGGHDDFGSVYDPYLFIQTTVEVIQSQIVLSNVVSTLNLNMEWGKKYYVGQTLKTTETRELLKRRLELKSVRNTSLIEITFYDDDRNEAAVIANAVANSYKIYRENSAKEAAARELQVSQQADEDATRTITQGEGELEVLRKKFDVVDDSRPENGQVSSTEMPQPSTPKSGAVSKPTLDNQPYWDKKKHLENLLSFQKDLRFKIATEKVDMLTGRNEVEIVDLAEPGAAPVKPNKVLNITIGAIAGVFFGTVAGSIAALITWRRGKRNPAPGAF